jgi:hypothetical protein
MLSEWLNQFSNEMATINEIKQVWTDEVDSALLIAVGEMVKQCIRKNGKATLPVNVARSILEARGVDIPVEDGRIRALLREKHYLSMTRKQRHRIRICGANSTLNFYEALPTQVAYPLSVNNWAQMAMNAAVELGLGLVDADVVNAL